MEDDLKWPKKPPRSKVCVYCCERPAVKNEHVVGKVFFDVLPNDMITVPSCKECDSGRGDGGPRDFHLDETYARNVFCMRADMGEHPVANKLMTGQVMRSFEKSAGLAKTVLGTSKLMIPKLKNGIVLPPTWAYGVELERIRRVTRKVVRGLHYAKEFAPLPKDIRIEVAVDPEEDFVLNCLSSFPEPNWFGLGDRVFMYKCARTAAGSLLTLWLFVWYGCFPVVAATYPKDRDDTQVAASTGI